MNHFLGAHFHRWWNCVMVKKINSTINYVIRFNCYLGYQIGFSLLYFHPEWKWQSPWKLWCSSPMYISGVYWYISYSVLSHFCFLQWWSGVMVRWFLMVQWWWWDKFFAAIFPSEICALEWFFFPGDILGDISRDSFPGQFVSQGNSRGTTFPGIGWYFCTYDDTD